MLISLKAISSHKRKANQVPTFLSSIHCITKGALPDTKLTVRIQRVIDGYPHLTRFRYPSDSLSPFLSLSFTLQFFLLCNTTT